MEQYRNASSLAENDKKKGTIKFSIPDEEMSKIQHYQPKCNEYLRWVHTKANDLLVCKSYKDSVYWGVIEKETGTRNGKGVINYTTGRLYEGDWL